MIISLIVAMDRQRGIGKHGRLPWRLSTDLRRFKSLTMGHHLAMGRKTYESIGKPLPGRVSLIITRKRGYQAEGCVILHSLEEALAYTWYAGEAELFVIGGGEIFSQALPLAERIYLTEVDTDACGDTFFPEIRQDEWEVISMVHFPAGERDEFAHVFYILERKSA